jgi:hypothetical protein
MSIFNLDALTIVEEIWSVIGPSLSGLKPDAEAFVKNELKSLAEGVAVYGNDLLSGQSLDADETKIFLLDWKDHFLKEVMPIAVGMGEEAVEIASAKSVSVAMAIINGVIGPIGSHLI